MTPLLAVVLAAAAGMCLEAIRQGKSVTEWMVLLVLLMVGMGTLV